MFDMNDILFLFYINMNQQEYVMVNVVDIEDLFDVDYHNDLDINSRETKNDKDIYLRLENKVYIKSNKRKSERIFYVDNLLNFSYQVQY
jgi:hypothetical protein